MTHTTTYPECSTILNIKDELRNTCCHGHEVFAMLIGYIPCIYSVYFNFQFLIYVIKVSATYYFRKHFTYSTRIYSPHKQPVLKSRQQYGLFLSTTYVRRD